MASTNRLTPLTCAFWLFTAGVVLLPIGFGGNRPLPFGLFQGALATSALLFLSNKEVLAKCHWPLRVRTALLLFFAVMLWGLVQSLPVFPAPLAHPIWQEAAEILKPLPVKPTIALSPEAALDGLSRFFTYVMAGFLAFCLGQKPEYATTFLRAFWFTGCGLCFYGLALKLAGTGTLLGVEKWAYKNDLTATFVNRNHFALYADFVFMAGLGLALRSWRHHKHNNPFLTRASLFKNWLKHSGLFYSGTLGALILCIFLSHARVGLVITCLGMVIFFFLYRLYRRSGMAPAIIGLGVLTIFFLGLAPLFSDRFAGLMDDYSSRDRFKIYGFVLNALGDNPLLGYGLNGFPAVFRLYQQNMLMEFNHAHSDILESLLDLGLIGGLALWLAFMLLIIQLFQGVRTRRRHRLFPILGLTLTLMALCHALVDFGLQIPGISVTLATFLGIGLAQSMPGQEKA